MSTHPSTPERVSRAIAAARQIGAPGVGEAGREEYLTAVAGVDFGEDPRDGLVRGRRFLHGKLGFSFVAPEGFTLNNLQSAVLGVTTDGNEGLRLDSVRTPLETPLDEYMRTGWVEGLNADSLRLETINGLPGALAIASGAEWKFRVAVVRLGGEVYRIIFANRTMSPDSDKRYLAAINSFRRLPPREAESLRPLKLSVVVARKGETTASMAERMNVSERAQDLFMLLNGLRRSGPLDAGTRYKIIVCFSASNLLEVSKQFPDGLIIADHDPVGIRTAKKINRPYWVSPNTGEDFNDFELRVGADIAGKSLIALLS
jgi:predicted Zn-dependent protease